jgi:hypothetical protein
MRVETSMNKLVRLIQNYLIVGFPFVIALFLWEYFLDKNSNMTTGTLRAILSINVMVWMSALIVFLIMLVILPAVREKTLRRLANIKDRDEREEYITGKAARDSYIATLSLMIFLFFMSIFTLQLRPITENQGIKGKPHWALEMNIGFQFVDKAASNDIVTMKSKPVFSTENITPSKPAMILILMCWQLLIFNLSARKEQI